MIATLAFLLLDFAGAACLTGDEPCPSVLHMRRGSVSIAADGAVTAERPARFFAFDARAGQTLVVRVVSGNLKTSGGIPLRAPGGGVAALDVESPYRLPETGRYVLQIHANTMSEEPWGPFEIAVTIR